MSPPKGIRAISLESQLLHAYLTKAAESAAAGGKRVLSYDELSTVVCRNVQREARHCLTTARKKLLREQNVFFDCLRSVGLKLCDDDEKVEAGASFLRKIRRSARQGAKITASVQDYATMSREKQVQHNAQLSLYGAMYDMTAQNKVKALEAKVEQAQKKLPLAKTLEAIGSQ